MFHTDLLTEYSRAASLGLSNQLLQLAEQSFNAAFLPRGQTPILDDFRRRPNRGDCYNCGVWRGRSSFRHSSLSNNTR